MKKTFTINEITSVKCHLRGTALGMGYGGVMEKWDMGTRPSGC